MNETINPRIHLRKPITGLKVSYYGPEPIPAEESSRLVDEAYQRGKSDAEEVCQRQILQARKEMSILQNEVLSAVQNRYNEFSEQFDQQLPDLVLSIVGKVWEGLNLGREDILRAIDSALSEVGSDTQKLVLRLNPRDASLLQGTETFQTRYPDLKVETDPELVSGDVIIHSRFGIVDSRIKTKIRRVEEEIKKVHQ